MAEKSLVDRDIDFGKRVVTALDQAEDADMHPTAALWFSFPDEDVWRLVLAVPAMRKQNPQEVYAKLIGLLSGNVVGDMSVESVGLTAPESPLLNLLSVAIQTPPDAIVGIRFTNNVINGQLIPDAYIYRLSRDAPAAGTPRIPG